MLAGMALKWRWRARREQAGKTADRPNLVMGANVQVCWEKFCRYWEVEPRMVPMEGDTYHLTAERAVTAVMRTRSGSSRSWARPSTQLRARQGDRRDFRLARVQSINSSGHKYGLVYPGVGWAVWRDPAALPRELVFDVNYRGGKMPTFSLNFSRPGSEVIAQYFMLMSLGRVGFETVMRNLQQIAQQISAGVAELGPYRLLSDGSELPVFAFALAPEVVNYTVFDASDRLRGWLVPAYSFPANREDLSVLRIVVRHGRSVEMADLLLEHLGDVTAELEGLDGPLPRSDTALKNAFAH